MIDDRARADYRRRLAELRNELEDAERCNDPGRAAAARDEIEQLAARGPSAPRWRGASGRICTRHDMTMSRECDLLRSPSGPEDFDDVHTLWMGYWERF
jgi:hypothetical protein